MGALESNTTLIYGIHIRESANDGSDFSNAAADYRIWFVGEDGLLHLKDSAGVVTTPAQGGIQATIVDAAGDLIVADAADSVVRLARGTDGQFLRSTGSSIAWESIDWPFQAIIDGGGSAVTTGAKGFFYIPFSGTWVTSWAFSDVSTTTAVDLWKDTTANHPPTDADSQHVLSISAGFSDVDTGQSIAVTAGDTVRFNVDSNDNATILNVGIAVRPS